MLIKIKKTILIYNMLAKGDRVLVGLSGGPDSVCLLYILKNFADEYKLTLYAAHLNHRLRGRESDRDEKFCRELCRKLDLPFIVKKVKIIKKGGSLEDSARKTRYSFFEEAAKKTGANKIALAHNADDQAETVLMRFLRGAGAKGLSGVPPKRSIKAGEKMGAVPILIRPLIDIRKEEILDFLKKRKIGYCVDSSNKKLDFFRNRVRHELIPYLQKYNMNIKNILLSTGKNMAMVDDYLESVVEDEYERLLRRHGSIGAPRNDIDAKFIDITYLKKLPQIICQGVIRKAAQEFESKLNLSAEQVSDILALISDSYGSRELCLSYDVKIAREYDNLLFVRGKKEKPQFKYKLTVPGKLNISECNILVTSEICRNIEKKARNFFEVNMDCDKILRPLIIRNKIPGDVFQPIGFKGKKKVKDIFIDQKVPERIRGRIPMFVSGREICWIPGYRVGKNFKIEPQTRKIVKIKVEGLE